MAKERVLSGMRASGRLHLGHLHGVLENWLALQDSYDCLYFVADWHALTTEFSNPSEIRAHTREMVLDWLSVGLDPSKCTIFIQSQIKEHAELHLLLSMITPLSWLERNPTFKDMQEESGRKDLANYGLFGYPVLQAADILLYKAQRVPIGDDQLPHLEIAREIARRFNHLYGSVFTVPEPLLTNTPKLLGIDGRKMSKSYNNAIYLTDNASQLEEKFRQMFTVPARARRGDPGEPEICPVFSYHRLYCSCEKVLEIEKECRRAGIGCVECKGWLLEKVKIALAPLAERRNSWEGKETYIREILENGRKKATRFARNTMEEVREAMGVGI